jgi:hypothetical protein
MKTSNIDNNKSTIPEIKKYSKNYNSEVLRKQKTIRVTRDIVTSTWLKFHPFLGKPDEVVWYYGLLQDELERKIKKNQKPISFSHNR